MPDYTLSQLADLAAVTPRTIRFYIAQGLLASPGAGPGARYTDDHLERLRLIKQLQRNHLPLAEIRAQLNRESATDYIRAVIGPAPLTGPVPPRSAPLAARAAMLQAPAWLAPPRSAAQPVSTPRPPEPDRSQWDRVTLAPDVELHIRRPLTRDQNKRVDRLIAVARELFEEERP